MKTMRMFETRGLILILGAVLGIGVGIGFAPAAFAQNAVIVNPDGKVTYVDFNVSTSGINDWGQVAGASVSRDDNTHAFITGPNGKGMIDLGTLDGKYSIATGINNSGQAVGYSKTKELDSDRIPVNHAFITGPDGKGMTDLGTLGLSSFAEGINDSGQVAGTSYGKGHEPHAFITGPNGKGMTDLGAWSIGQNINDSGQVVGYRYIEEGRLAFITGPDGKGMTDLDTLGGAVSYAADVNESGQVVGFSTIVDSYPYLFHAFITGPNGKGVIDLGTLGGAQSLAFGINESGQVVGYSETADGSHHAFITGPNGQGMIDLNSYADLPEGYFLTRPPNINTSTLDINNQGQVLAYVSNVPVPPYPRARILRLDASRVGFGRVHGAGEEGGDQYRCARLK